MKDQVVSVIKDLADQEVSFEIIFGNNGVDIKINTNDLPNISSVWTFAFEQGMVLEKNGERVVFGILKGISETVLMLRRMQRLKKTQKEEARC